MDYLVSEPNYHTITLQSFHRNFISNRNKKTETLTSKPVYVGLSTLELTNISMYEFWYDYVKPKHSEKAKMCYIDTDTLVYAQKQMIFIKILQKMLKLDLVFQLINQIDHYKKEKVKKKLD